MLWRRLEWWWYICSRLMVVIGFISTWILLSILALFQLLDHKLAVYPVNGCYGIHSSYLFLHTLGFPFIQLHYSLTPHQWMEAITPIPHCLHISCANLTCTTSLHYSRLEHSGPTILLPDIIGLNPNWDESTSRLLHILRTQVVLRLCIVLTDPLQNWTATAGWALHYYHLLHSSIITIV